MRVCLNLDVPPDVIREVLSWYGVDVPEGADVAAAWNAAVARRRGA